ncbi:endonuclease III [Coxiella endosymbiont of Ornithodoros amblus]|nr:endonuclease III [Coxiella endosymbiont of Ornithodoros amblus]
MDQTEREEIFHRFKTRNHKPVSELIYHSGFELLISVMLSAKATDISVNKATKDLYRVANTPTKMLALGESGLKKYIKSIGLYNTKAKNIIKTCKVLIENYHSKVPRTREELEALPGVGRKTANVILNTAFGEHAIAVDTHIFRVANRTGLARGKTPLLIEKKLMEVVPKKYLADAHHWLVLHGRYICIARRPKCSECLINDLCEYPEKRLSTYPIPWNDK